MRLVPSIQRQELAGICDACEEILFFTQFENEIGPYYEADDIVNKWMDHQLNDCKPLVIDNPGGIG